LAIVRLTRGADWVAILSLASTFFTQEEVACVQELLDIYLHRSGQRDYTFLSCEDGNRVVGFACYGPTPLTEATFSLYWMCVDRDYRKHGVGSLLLADIEDRVRQHGGALLLAETSSQPAYMPARRFYSAHGFHRVARIHDFYAEGDDLLVYSKRCLRAADDTAQTAQACSHRRARAPLGRHLAKS